MPQLHVSVSQKSPCLLNAGPASQTVDRHLISRGDYLVSAVTQ